MIASRQPELGASRRAEPAWLDDAFLRAEEARRVPAVGGPGRTEKGWLQILRLYLSLRPFFCKSCRIGEVEPGAWIETKPRQIYGCPHEIASELVESLGVGGIDAEIWGITVVSMKNDWRTIFPFEN